MSYTDAVVMILRVWVLYNQLMLVFSTLLTIYAMEGISIFISDVIFIAQPENSENEPR